MAKLTHQRDHYKKLALIAKKNNDKDTALLSLAKMKQFQAAIDSGNLDFRTRSEVLPN